MRFATAWVIALVLLAASAHASDSRLAHKVTYQGGYKRLHAVAEELTKQTGVTIRAGDSKQDWHVRDIPLTVCVKDMPLGKLLQTIANCAHVTFAAERIAGSKESETSYKLYRPRKQQEALTDYLKGRVEANRRIAEWSWDTLAAYADMPDASSDIPTTPMYDARQIRVVAEMLKSLGPDVKAKVLAGQAFTTVIGKSAGKTLKDVLDYASTSHTAYSIPAPATTNPPQAALVLIADSYDHPVGIVLSLVNVPPPPDQPIEGGGTIMWGVATSWLARGLASVKKLNLPAEPDVSSVYKDDDYPAPGFVELKADKDWDVPLLQTKVKLTASTARDGKRVPRELVEALKQSGVNIVCEDLASHLSAAAWWRSYPAPVISPLDGHTISGDDQPPAKQPDVEITVADALKATHNHQTRAPRWFYNKDAKTIVGWISGWQVAHLGMIPESMYLPIRHKMETVGAELDDMLATADLNDMQLRTWFEPLRVPFGMMALAHSRYPIWNLYRLLDDDQKQQAKSDEGLSLTALDRSTLRSLLPNRGLLRDDSVLSRTRLRIVRGPDDPSGGHYYSAEVVVRTDTDAQILAREEFDIVEFPFFTSEREAELIKKAQSNPAGK